MKINDLEVTNNYVDVIDENSAHIELGNCLRLVNLVDTEFQTIDELKSTVESLSFE